MSLAHGPGPAKQAPGVNFKEGTSSGKEPRGPTARKGGGNDMGGVGWLPYVCVQIFNWSISNQAHMGGGANLLVRASKCKKGKKWKRLQMYHFFLMQNWKTEAWESGNVI